MKGHGKWIAGSVAFLLLLILLLREAEHLPNRWSTYVPQNGGSSESGDVSAPGENPVSRHDSAEWIEPQPETVVDDGRTEPKKEADQPEKKPKKEDTEKQETKPEKKPSQPEVRTDCPYFERLDDGDYIFYGAEHRMEAVVPAGCEVDSYVEDTENGSEKLTVRYPKSELYITFTIQPKDGYDSLSSYFSEKREEYNSTYGDSLDFASNEGDFVLFSYYEDKGETVIYEKQYLRRGKLYEMRFRYPYSQSRAGDRMIEEYEDLFELY